LVDREQLPVERRVMRFTEREHVRKIRPMVVMLTPR
jgi:hypothetical protein